MSDRIDPKTGIKRLRTGGHRAGADGSATRGSAVAR